MHKKLNRVRTGYILSSLAVMISAGILFSSSIQEIWKAIAPQPDDKSFSTVFGFAILISLVTFLIIGILYWVSRLGLETHRKMFYPAEYKSIKLEDKYKKHPDVKYYSKNGWRIEKARTSGHSKFQKL